MQIDLSQSQLFLDDEIIEENILVQRTMHPPERFGHQPVLTHDRPWESRAVLLYGTVIRDEETGLFKMWYLGYKKAGPLSERTLICYAESEDGLHWEKPELGLCEFRGSKENNIVFFLQDGLIDNHGVLYTPDDPDENRRYKMLFYASYGKGNPRNGLYVAFSPNGIRWKMEPEPVLPGIGDRTTVMFDHFTGKYVTYCREPEILNRLGRRVICRSESEDFLHWSDPKLVLASDLDDPCHIQFYSLTAYNYESLYIGILEIYYPLEQKLDLQLTCSRDGVNWRRVGNRQVFFPKGPEGHWDSTWVSMGCNPPVLHEGRLWMWYGGRSTPHGAPYPCPEGSIGLALLRKDGFVSLEAGNAEGTVTTKPFVWPGGVLEINGQTHHGWIRVEVLDMNGKIIPGLSFGECHPLTSDCIDYQVSWKGAKDLNLLAGGKIKLRFGIKNAHLYSFRVR